MNREKELKLGREYYSTGNFYVTFDNETDTDYVFVDRAGTPWGGCKEDIQGMLNNGTLVEDNKEED